MSGVKNSVAVVLGLITIGVVIGVVLTTGFNIDSKSIASVGQDKIYQEAEATPAGGDETMTAGNFNPNAMFVDIVEKVRPSIVSIYTTKKVKMTHPFFRWFHGEGEGMPFDQEGQGEMRQQGLGSGIIISKDGYILTNHHVIEDVDEIRVKLTDKTEYEAKLIGTDPTTEIALIKVEAENLPTAVLGNSENVKIGEWVIAIGSPLYLTSTVTAGIVSALSRDINIISGGRNLTGIENFIQTDAAINPGNSGGALLNIRGEVIGVNTAIATNTRYYMGYGFAVPINIAKSVVNDLMEYGEVRRGYLGVYIQEVTPVVAKGVKLDKPRGVLITSVLEGSAAQSAGINDGDVILTVNGKEVNQPNTLQALIGTHNPGDEVELELWRDGKQIDMTVELQGQDNVSVAQRSGNKKSEEKSLEDLGLNVKDLNNREMETFELSNGVLIINVSRYSIASKAGLTRGEVIYELNGEDVNSVDGFYDMIGQYKSGEVIKLKLRRKQGNELFDRLVFLEIPE